MKAYKVYNETTDGWLSGSAFYQHAVYGDAFATYEDAAEEASVLDAIWFGHKIHIIEIDLSGV